LDLELEANQASPKTSRSNKRSSATAAAAASVAEQHTTSSSFAAINNTVADLGSDNAPTGGTSTPVPAPTPAPSKKRKHPSSSLPAATNHTMPANSRSRHAAHLPLKGFVETNMMSFSRCGRKLNAKKQLVADDGTAVQTNGTSLDAVDSWIKPNFP
jgi:hypothetical protein